jgi:dTDP-4-dehydrorhamnose reductase
MGNIVVFGSSGQLGQCLKVVSEASNIDNVIFPAEEESNILDLKAIEAVFVKYKPAYCINCAAYTAVDKAEDDVEIARKVNKDGAANLAKFCETYSATLIHISTDFVFSGDKPFPLSEDDVAEPVSIYGLTKLEGEQDIIAATERFYILRTSWLYSEYGNNFVKTMIRLGKEKTELKIISDQIGTPTYAIDLAKTIFKIIEADNKAYGVYHYSNEGVTSWYDFAMAIFDLANITIKVLPVRTSEYVTRAIRPSFSVMDKTKIKEAFDMEIPYWRESLKKCIEVLGE